MVEPGNNLLVEYYNSSNIPMWIIDVETFSFLDINEAAVKVLGYSKEEINQYSLLDLQFKDSQDSIVSLILNQRNNTKQSLESAIKTKNGKIIRFRFSVFQFSFQNKKSAIISIDCNKGFDFSVDEQEQLFIKEYESELNSFFNNSGSILVLFNKNLEVTAFNSIAQISARKIFQTEIKIGTKVYEILPEFFQQNFKDLALKALDGFETSNREINIPNTSYWWNLKYFPLYNQSGEIFGASFTAIDISERKKSEELLIKSEARFKSLTENATDIISMYDENFKTIYRSDSAYALTGRSLEEVDTNNSILQYLHPDDYTRLQPTIKLLLATRGIKIKERFRWRHIDGHYVWLEGTLTNLLHDENIRAIVTNLHDITEDIKLRDNQNLLAAIVESTDDAVISCSLDGKITSWNKSAENLLGFSEKEVLGDEFKLFIPTNLVLYESGLIEKTRNGSYFNQIQSKRLKKNGEVIDVSITMSPIRNEKNQITGVSKIIRDVTNLNRTKKELGVLIKELTNNNKELKQFSYIISHNLRAPLTNLMGIIKMVDLNSITDLKTKKLIEAFITSTKTLNDTIEDLIKIIIVKENSDHEVAALQLEKHLQRVIDSIRSTLQLSQIEIEFNFDEINIVHFNAAYLESIFLNLITNAIKYCQPGKTPHIKITSRIKNNAVQLIFTDNGLGMDWNKVKDKIFGLYQKFHRHPDSRGIGLYLIHSQITSLGGTIEVETEPNKGTTFFINFPAHGLENHHTD